MIKSVLNLFVINFKTEIYHVLSTQNICKFIMYFKDIESLLYEHDTGV